MPARTADTSGATRFSLTPLSDSATLAACLLNPERLGALDHLGLLSAAPAPAFDRVTALVRRVVGVPTALVSLVGPDRQVFASASGLPEPWATRRETPLSHSFCQHVVARDAPLVVEDARADARLSANGAVADLGVVAYLGVPIHSPDGHALGSLCAIDGVPRAWTDSDRATMADLAAVVESEIALRAEAAARTRAVAAARESAEQFRLLAETATDLILTMDAAGRIVYANAAAAPVLGYAPEALVGQPMSALVPERMRAAHGAGLARYLASGERRLSWDRFEVPMRRADGQEVPVSIALSDYARDGQTFFTGIVRDMTAEKAAEVALRRREAEFRCLAEALPQLVWTSRPDGTVLYANTRMLDYVGAEAPDAPWGRPVHPDDWPAFAEVIGQSVATATLFETEARLRRARDGQFRWHIVRAEPIRDGDGARWFGTCTDVHDLREARDRLRESGERLRLVQLATDDVVWDLDMRTGHTTWSAASTRRFGWEELTAVTDAQWWVDRIHPDDRDRVGDSFNAFLDGPADTWRESYRFLRADGSHAFIVDCGYLARDASGAPVRVVGAMMDLSERKALEDALVGAREEAETAARLKSALLANMSHEIRTPLTAVLGYAEILADEAPDDLRVYAETIRRGGERLLGTLNSVLDLAQIEGGTYTVRTEPVCVLAEARAACDALRPLASAKGVGLAVGGTPAAALADRAALGRVLNNLVGNAIKFTSAGSVSLRVEAHPGGVVLRVSDTGAGISEAFLPRLFDEFRQESEGDGRAHEGNGLGLAITRRLVDLMGGEIAVESALGKGSTFTVRLPPAEAPCAADHAADRAAADRAAAPQAAVAA